MLRRLTGIVLGVVGGLTLLVCVIALFGAIYFAGFATCTDTADCKDVASAAGALTTLAAVSALAALLTLFLLRALRRSKGVAEDG